MFSKTTSGTICTRRKVQISTCDGTNVEDILGAFDSVCEALDIHPGRFTDFFPVLRNCLMDNLSYKYKELWKILEKKSKLSVYGGGKQAAGLRVLVIGGGPVGLR